jgi:ferredoxin
VVSTPVTIRVDRSRCLTSGQCMTLAPALFEQDDDAISTVMRQPATDTEVKAALHAARICPSQAITVSDTNGTDTGEQ